MAEVDHFMRLQQTLGSANIAARESNYDVATAKLDYAEKYVQEWKEAIAAAKEKEAKPAEPVKDPEPPAESIEFSVNVTFTPDKCPRKSVEGSVMKVHYVGKLLSTKKIFASSFHTGSMPFRFVLGSDEVVEGWNKGLEGMCQGERRRLMVPWTMAYGAEGGKGVPPYSDVQYDFELTELTNPKIPKTKKKTEL
uniref:peptidylprolyl isomerase n=1 Tax=Haptolina ericina TaxID=156174 RepID=A0A7S3AG13_9EUKA